MSSLLSGNVSDYNDSHISEEMYSQTKSLT